MQDEKFEDSEGFEEVQESLMSPSELETKREAQQAFKEQAGEDIFADFMSGMIEEAKEQEEDKQGWKEKGYPDGKEEWN